MSTLQRMWPSGVEVGGKLKQENFVIVEIQLRDRESHG